mgnify:FL=1
MVTEEVLFQRFLNSHNEELDAYNELITYYVQKAMDEGVPYLIVGTEMRTTVVNEDEKTVIPSILVHAEKFTSENQMRDFYLNNRFSKEWRYSLMFEIKDREVRVLKWK